MTRLIRDQRMILTVRGVIVISICEKGGASHEFRGPDRYISKGKAATDFTDCTGKGAFVAALRVIWRLTWTVEEGQCAS